MADGCVKSRALVETCTRRIKHYAVKTRPTAQEDPQPSALWPPFVSEGGRCHATG